MKFVRTLIIPVIGGALWVGAGSYGVAAVDGTSTSVSGAHGSSAVETKGPDQGLHGIEPGKPLPGPNGFSAGPAPGAGFTTFDSPGICTQGADCPGSGNSPDLRAPRIDLSKKPPKDLLSPAEGASPDESVEPYAAMQDFVSGRFRELAILGTTVLLILGGMILRHAVARRH